MFFFRETGAADNLLIAIKIWENSNQAIFFIQHNN